MDYLKCIRLLPLLFSSRSSGSGTIGMFLAVPIMMILLIILSQFESTKNLAVLISEDGNILRNNDN